MNYLQKKKQAIIMMLAAQIVKSAQGYPVAISDSKSGAAVDYTVYGNTGAIGKNLIPYPYHDTTKTINGITFTDNGDGSITVNGTAAANAIFRLHPQLKVPKGKYFLSGLNAEGSFSTFWLNITVYNSDTVVKTSRDLGSGSLVDLSAVDIPVLNAYIIIMKGVTVNNITVKPQLELGTAATEYELYKEGYVGDKTDNLIDEDTVLTAQGWVKQADGSYYVENNRDVYQKKIWENTEGYTGRLRVSYRFKYAKSKAEAGAAGVFLTVSYTDGTTSDVWLNTSSWDADTWLLPNESYTLTKASKTVDSIWWIYGTGANSTWVKNVFVSKNTAVTQYESYGYRIRIVNSGKNLIPYPYYSTTQTTNGVTFTDNGDGSVTVNGTATANAYNTFWLDLENIDTTKKYVLSGSTNNVHVYVTLYQGKTWKKEYMSKGQPIVIEFPTDIEFNRISASSYVYNGYTANNETIRPQLELGETATEYVPYRAPSTAVIYRSAPLKKGESINFRSDGLPKLTLFEGENIITATTAIKPEKISVDYYEK